MKKLIRSTLMLLCLVAALPAQEPEPDFTVATFNVFNWGLANRHIDGVFQRDAMKPESEKKAVVNIIKELNADVLVIQEIILNDAQANIKDIRNHIADAGLSYPHYVFSTGEDTRIGLLLLSRLPFIESHILNEDEFSLKNSSGARTTLRVSRGIAHAAVEPLPGKRIDILGVHFKSRIAKSEYDDPDTGVRGDLGIRRQEALIARGHALRLLREHPGTRIIILGDFNDHTRHPNEPEGPIEILTRPRDTVLPLHILNITDNVGDLWTHYFAAQATYDRIDMIIVNDPLRREFLPAHSFIYRQKDGLPCWRDASDHRAVRAAFSIN